MPIILTSCEDPGFSGALQVIFNCHKVHCVLSARLQVPEKVLCGWRSHIVGPWLTSSCGTCSQTVSCDYSTGPRPQHQYWMLRGIQKSQVGGGIKLWGRKCITCISVPVESLLRCYLQSPLITIQKTTGAQWSWAYIFSTYSARATVGKREPKRFHDSIGQLGNRSQITTSTPQCHLGICWARQTCAFQAAQIWVAAIHAIPWGSQANGWGKTDEPNRTQEFP